MGFFDKLFNKRERVTPPTPQVSGRKRGDGGSSVSLQVVFANERSYTAGALQRELRKLDASTRSAEVQGLEGTYEQGTPATRVEWGSHVVDVVGFDYPFPKEALEWCVQSAYYPQEQKAAARTSRAHALLFYAGEEARVSERYAALAVVAAAFSKLGATTVLNEHARISLPANVIHKLATQKTNFELLRTLPRLYLYAGLVKFVMQDGGVWLRTYGSDIYGLPDFAIYQSGHQHTQSTMDMFETFLNYLETSGRQFAAGNTAQHGETTYRFRGPRDNDVFPIDSKGRLLVLERIS